MSVGCTAVPGSTAPAVHPAWPVEAVPFRDRACVALLLFSAGGGE